MSRFPRLIFFGTPDFAVPSLKVLSSAGADVVLVVTQPDRPSGRGKKVTASPVKSMALELELPVYQPERVRQEGVLEYLRSFHAECAAVVAYGQILPRALLDLFPLGAVNVHASLLPRYRGAAPMQRAILSGEEVTGVSIMLLDAGMDTGPVLTRAELSIAAMDNLGSVHDKLANLGAELLLEILPKWKEGAIEAVPQDDSLATSAPPLLKEELRVRWTDSARQIVDRIRAFDPFPGAYGVLGGKRVKLFDASVLPWSGAGSPGEVVGPSDRGLVVLGGDGQALAMGSLQLEGQRRVPAADFLRGRPLPPGTHFE